MQMRTQLQGFRGVPNDSPSPQPGVGVYAAGCLHVHMLQAKTIQQEMIAKVIRSSALDRSQLSAYLPLGLV